VPPWPFRPISRQWWSRSAIPTTIELRLIEEAYRTEGFRKFDHRIVSEKPRLRPEVDVSDLEIK
jgi:hypothetical protein